MTASACLVTSSPTFEDPPATKPYLEFETAQPDPRKIVVIDGSVALLTFQAFVRSEDAGERVDVRLMVDYGTCDFDVQRPFAQSFTDGDIAAASFDDTGRIVSARFAPNDLEGCHRITLMASHAFDDATGCPVDPEDFTQITWTVFSCLTPAAEGGCGPIDPASCPPLEASCTNFDFCREAAP